MLGKVNWYLPRWFFGRVLPHISIEGAEFFRARDQLPADEPVRYARFGLSSPVNVKER